MQYTLALNQRWCDGRASYRPPTEPIRTAEYEVAEIPDDTTVREFILQHHYSHSYPSARFRVGLYRHGELAGVAVFSHPCSNAVLTNVFEAPVLTTVELGRFVLLDSVAGNGETWFLARAFDVIRKKGIVGVVSFSDPLQRRTASGEVIQAHNGTYLGRGTAKCTPSSTGWQGLLGQSSAEDSQQRARLEVRSSATRGLRCHRCSHGRVGAHRMAQLIPAITGNASPAQGKSQVCLASQRRDPASTAGEPSLSEVAGPHLHRSVRKEHLTAANRGLCFRKKGIMADWSGTARSNYFEVKDLAAFKTWLESHSLSLLEDDADPGKPSTKVGFTAANTDHGAWPSSIWNEETDENEEFDLVSELWQHLVEGQVAVLMEVGSERYRYVTGQAIAVRWDGRVVHLSLNDIYEKAAREFGVDVKSITPAEY